jgi:hypothetical protein
LVIRPWARWSGISGITFDALNEEATPGRYAEWAMEVAYYFKPMSDLTLGVSVEGRQRQFFETHALNGARRADIFLSPGFSATRSNILSCACDLLLDYNYRLNQSNDSDSRYQGHRVTLSFASHF